MQAALDHGDKRPAKNGRLHVVTYNIHKGFSQLNRRMMVHELRDRLRAIGPDILFLQEVQNQHHGHAERHSNWPLQAQSEFLADSVWIDHAYGCNATYDAGHHGNAILSRYPIVSVENEDISSHRFEKRGLLHCEIAVPGWQQHLHCVCVHFALLEGGRRRQLQALALRVARLVPDGAPLIVAGDFNDWRDTASPVLQSALGLNEAFHSFQGRPARSYPSNLPMFTLDRIYVRGFAVHHARTLKGRAWSRMSDHVALSALLEPHPQ